MPTVLMTRQLPAAVRERLATGCEYRIGAEHGSMSREDLLAGVREVEGLICQLTDTIDREVIEAGSRLKVIANVAVGYNNIDVAAARQRGIVVTNTPDVLTEATADLTWALLLAVTRRVVEADAFLRAGKFTGWDFEMLLGTGLTGKTLGILGYGRIGKAVARRAAGFGMRVVYCTRDEVAFRDDPRHFATTAVSEGDPISHSARLDGLAARRVSFDQLLQLSDIVTLHLPLAATTRHLIDRAALEKMKPTAFLINTARGPVVDEPALIEALREGRLAGAGLDVFEEEPRVPQSLIDLTNVVLLPHIGSATHETRTAMAMLAAENVLDIFAGRQPRTPVG